MSQTSTRILKNVLSALHASRAHRLAAPWTRGVGAIFMLHQVTEPTGRTFEPSRILQVTPDFLETTIRVSKEEGFDLVSLDEAHHRLTVGAGHDPFIAFTLDDGYRDNLTDALPVFEAHNVPFTVYLPDQYADGSADLWWLALEEVLRRADNLTVKANGTTTTYNTKTLDDKTASHEAIYWQLRNMDEDAARQVVRDWAARFDVDTQSIAADLLMSWDEVRTLNASPLATIGAHTSGHYAMAKLPVHRMHAEVADNIARLANELGETPQHFSYPYGCAQSAGAREFEHLKSLKMKTAVTTRKGMLFPEHAEHLTALPRFSLNGDFQNARHLRVLLSGAPFMLWNKGRRLNVA